jgi:hypothetical protein
MANGTVTHDWRVLFCFCIEEHYAAFHCTTLCGSFKLQIQQQMFLKCKARNKLKTEKYVEHQKDTA